MSSARYFLPEHPRLTDVYSKAELRGMLQRGELSRSDMVTDDETGKGYLLGDLLMMPFPDVAVVPLRSTSSLPTGLPPQVHEFRADTPLPKGEREDDDGMDEEDEEDEEEEEQEEDSERWRRERERIEDQDQEFEERTERVRGGGGAESPADESEDEGETDGGEELLYEGHPSWMAFPRSLLVAAVCLGSAVYFYQHGVRWEWITLPGSIAGLIVLFIGLERATTVYFVTTRRVELEYGIIGRNTKEVRICDIRAIDVVQRGFEAVVGLGAVKFDSAASGGPEVCFRNVRKPHAIKQLVRELQG